MGSLELLIEHWAIIWKYLFVGISDNVLHFLPGGLAILNGIIGLVMGVVYSFVSSLPSVIALGSFCLLPGLFSDLVRSGTQGSRNQV